MKKVIALALLIIALLLSGCVSNSSDSITTVSAETETSDTVESEKQESTENTSDSVNTETSAVTNKDTAYKTVVWDDNWQFADFSIIHTDSANLYYAQDNRKNITVCVNAGHGTNGGGSVSTYCHPDKSAKVVSGSTAAGATKSAAVAYGTTMLDGTPEKNATLSLAIILKDKLLENGYNVLMIRESDDVQLDNVARTVMANNNADCHISVHYDSTETDKGLFVIGVPNVSSYLNMEPVASHYKEHKALGDAIIRGAKAKDVKVFSNGYMNIDLTQTSYSTVPSVDVEVGDRKSDYSELSQSKIADGIVEGLNLYYSE